MRLVAFAAALAMIASPSPARGNGAFPLANQLLANPSDPSQLVLRGTFGLVVSRDAGASWDFICEAGMGYENIEPPVAVLGSGVILLALPTGIARSDPSWCHFAPAAGIDDNVVDISVERAAPGAAVAVSVDLVARSSTVWGSSDDGESWTALSDTFTAFQATTIDVAPSDSSRIYVSGRTLPDGTGTLLRSDDHGQSWSALEVPALIPSQPYIAAVDPLDPDLVYVRRNGTPGTLWVTRDGGESFTMALRLNGPLKAFALSPEGDQIVAGSLTDGIHRAPADTLAFERVACDGAQCLSWNESGLLSCGDLVVNRYLVGKSPDAGESFDPILLPSCVRGPLACEATTSTSVCADAWSMVRLQLSTLSCEDDPGALPASDACFETAGAGGEGGQKGEGGNSAESAGAGGLAGGEPGGSTPAQSPRLTPSGGGPCSFGSKREQAWTWAVIVAGLLAVRRRRAHRRICAGLTSGNAGPAAGV